MSEPIRTADLREYRECANPHPDLYHRDVLIPGRPEGSPRWEHDIENCALCALLDVAEAANAVERWGWGVRRIPTAVNDFQRLRTALTRLDFTP